MVKAGEHELSGKKSNRASDCGLMCNVTLSTVSQVCGLVLLRQWAPYWWCVSGILFRCCVFKSCLSPAKMLQTILQGAPLSRREPQCIRAESEVANSIR